ncbi:MAG: RidA family protein [Chloroflexi bacterium]|nr:RidA family protein [Chloroflexota bacterium]
MRRASTRAELRDTELGYSLWIDDEQELWLSGLTAADLSESGVAVEAELEHQAQEVYGYLALLLREPGLNLQDVTRVVEYVTPEALPEYPELAELRRGLFGKWPPVTSTVVVPRLLRAGALIQVEAVATRRGSAPVVTPRAVDTQGRALARRVGDFMYLSTQLPVQPTGGAVVAPGDVGGQSRQIFENAAEVLRAEGLTLPDVVKIVSFATPAASANYGQTREVRGTYLAPRYAASTALFQPQTEHPDALVQVDFIASAAPKVVVNPGWTRYEGLAYVPAIKSGNQLFVSGFGSLNGTTGAVEHVGDLVAQTRNVYEKILRVVETAGGTAANVVKLQEYVVPRAMPWYAEVAPLRREHFGTPPPAGTAIVCEALVQPEMLIEVDAWVVL